MSKEEAIRSLVSQFFQCYLVERNIKKLQGFFDQSITWIGTGAGEFCYDVTDGITLLEKEFSQLSYSFLWEVDWWKVKKLSDDIYLVYGVIIVKTDEKTILESKMIVRTSVIMRKSNEEWKVAHLHCSVANPDQENGEFFPINKHKKKNKQLASLIEEKTQEIGKQREELIRSNQQLQEMIKRDSMTMLYNQKGIFDCIQTQINQYKGNPIDFVVMIMDIDNFKKINDSQGHIIGDTVIYEVARIVEKQVKAEGKIGRYGGDEFIVLLPDYKLTQAAVLAEKIRDAVMNLETSQYKGKITLSIGIAQYVSGQTIQQVLTVADQQLYLAKNNGKNRICFNQID